MLYSIHKHILIIECKLNIIKYTMLKLSNIWIYKYYINDNVTCTTIEICLIFQYFLPISILPSI